MKFALFALLLTGCGSICKEYVKDLTLDCPKVDGVQWVPHQYADRAVFVCKATGVKITAPGLVLTAPAVPEVTP